MSEHDHDNLTELLGEAPDAGPLPASVSARLRDRREARRARVAGGAAAALGVLALAAAVLVRFASSPGVQSGALPPHNHIVVVDPSDDQPLVRPEPAPVAEPLQIDDPMFASMDSWAGTGPAENRWTIGSHLYGEWPSGL